MLDLGRKSIAAEIAAVKGIGPKLAEDIVAFLARH